MKNQKPSAINLVFLFFVIGSILCGSLSGKMKAVTEASFQAAKDSVTLAIGLIGIMALWLGFVRILEAGGLMFRLGQALRPIMIRLFPDVPPEHPAMGAMVLNISANMLGLGNAATPFGIKAMMELNKLNPLPGTATNAMCLFLAINTSSVTIFPLGVIGLRAAAGSERPAEIFLPTIIATMISTAVGICVALWLAKRDTSYTAERTAVLKSGIPKSAEPGGEKLPEKELPDYSHLVTTPDRWAKWVSAGATGAFLAAIGLSFLRSAGAVEFFTRELLEVWLMPALMLAIVLYGVGRGVKVYEAVTDGAKQGFDTAVRIIPFLVAILVAIAMFRASGGMDILVATLNPITSLIGMPPEVLPMALVRPLSGTGAFGLLSATVQNAPNSYEAYVASTMQGAFDTTFYIIAVYFGAVGVSRVRHAVAAGLAADIAGTLAACFACRLLWQG